MKLMRSIVVMTLIAGLLLGMVLPALANNDATELNPAITYLEKGPPEGKGQKVNDADANGDKGKSPLEDKKSESGSKVKVIRGVVIDVDDSENEIKVEVQDSKDVVLIVDNAKFKIPTLGKDANIDDIENGMVITALSHGIYEDDGGLYAEARHIVVIPGKPVYRHHVGEVIDYDEDDSITIQPKRGDEVTFEINKELYGFKILPPRVGGEVDEGDWVTVISRRYPFTQELIATGVVVHPSSPSLPPPFRIGIGKFLSHPVLNHLQRIDGEITNTDDGIIAIRVDDGDEVTLEYNDNTVVILGGIISLEEGQSAIAFYEKNGNNMDGTARLVLVRTEYLVLEEEVD